MRRAADLADRIEAIDGRGYKAYRDLEGAWVFHDFELHIDRVQSDPFASPSKMRVRVDRAVTPIAEISPPACESRVRRIACASFLARAFRDSIRSVSPRRSGTGKGGLVSIDAGGQEVLERTAVVVGEDFLEARFELGLPAAGRRIRGHDAAALLLESLPKIVAHAWIDRGDAERRRCQDFVNQIENQESIRRQLDARGLIAFVGDGASLPRVSGASDAPMPSHETRRFTSPPSLRVSFEVPHSDEESPDKIWRGMGVPRGVVLLVGGGYHGKSTLLRAIERSVVPHIPGDGRERVVSSPSLVKIRAEEGRAVTGVDIAGFIDRLPAPADLVPPKDTRFFSSPDASGSTSQAANLFEALEAGASGLLLDEDTSATNFMIRDARMQALISANDEPITPFVERVRELYDRFGISSLLVMGASGDYFKHADVVLALGNYEASDVTEAAHALVQMHAEETTGAILRDSQPSRDASRPDPKRAEFGLPRARVLDPLSIDARRGRRDVKFSSRGCEEIVYGENEIDLRAVEQLLDPSQTRAVAAAIYLAATRFMSMDPPRTLSEVLDDVDRFLESEGLDALDPYFRSKQHPGAFARPRRFEIAAALNRLRSLRVKQQPDSSD